MRHTAAHDAVRAARRGLSGKGLHRGPGRIAGCGCEKFFERGVIHGRGEEISLAKFAAKLFEVSELAARFDALGNYLQV